MRLRQRDQHADPTFQRVGKGGRPGEDGLKDDE